MEEGKLKTKKQTSQNMLEENIKIYDQTMEEKHHEKKEIEVILLENQERLNAMCYFFNKKG